MHLETVSEFKIMQSKPNIGYTYFRFDKNAHKELVDRPVAAFEIGGAFLLIPLPKSPNRCRVITDEIVNERLNEVVSRIRGLNEVITTSDGEKTQINNQTDEQTIYQREGGRAWPNATDLRSVPEEVRRFESGPSHPFPASPHRPLRAPLVHSLDQRLQSRTSNRR